jgi:hypothetical protein
VKNAFVEDEDKKTDGIRCALTFLQFLETKILNSRKSTIDSQDVPEIAGFKEFVDQYISE